MGHGPVVLIMGADTAVLYAVRIPEYKSSDTPITVATTQMTSHQQTKAAHMSLALSDRTHSRPFAFRSKVTRPSHWGRRTGIGGGGLPRPAGSGGGGAARGPPRPAPANGAPLGVGVVLLVGLGAEAAAALPPACGAGVGVGAASASAGRISTARHCFVFPEPTASRSTVYICFAIL